VARTADNELLDLVGRTYDAALDETLWAALADGIAQTFQSPSCTLHLIHPHKGELTFLGRTENIAENMESYTAYYHARDLWVEGALSVGLGKVSIGHELVSDAKLLRSEFYSDWCRKADQRYIAGTVFPVDGDLGVVAVHRPAEARDYAGEDKRRIAAFLSHLRRALQIRNQLCDASLERHATLDVLDRIDVACVVVTGSSHVVYANALAESLLRQGDAIRVIAGRLVSNDQVAGRRLSLAVVEAVSAASGNDAAVNSTFAIAREDRLPLTVMVAPLRPAQDGFGAAIPSAIVFVRDLEKPTLSSRALRGLFGLTAAEANIAAKLAKGVSLEGIAAAHCVSLNTVRTHLKNVLTKTNTRRQAELVALLLRSVATMVEK